MPIPWFSLDKGDGEPVRYLGHLIAALRWVCANAVREGSSALQSLQPQPAEAILTSLSNEIATLRWET